MINAVLVTAFFGLASLRFNCQVPDSIDKNTCSEIRNEFATHGIPLDRSELLGTSGELKITVRLTKIPIDDDTASLSIETIRVQVKRPLVDPDDEAGHIYNAVVYMRSDTALINTTTAKSRIMDTIDDVVDEIASEWNKSHTRDSA